MSKKQNQKNTQPSRKGGKIAAVCIGAAAVLGAAAFGGYQYLKQSGYFLRGKIALETAHYQISSAMLAYYFQENVTAVAEYHAAHPDSVMFDENISLKKQEYITDMTWYEHLMDNTVTAASSTLQMCESAYDAGFSLSEEELAACLAAAEDADLSNDQRGVRQEDIAEAIKLKTLAERYEQSYIDAFSADADDIQAYCEEHQLNYLSWSMLCYTFSWASDPENTALQNTAAAHAEALAACHTEDAFLTYVRDYLRDDGRDEAAIESMIAGAKITNSGSAYSDTIQDWVLSKGAAIGDTMTVTNSERYNVQVYQLLTEPTLDTAPLADLRVIYLNANTYGDLDGALKMAEALQRECEAAGSTPESFAALAADYSEDALTVDNGGLVTGYSRNRSLYGAETADWAFASDRKQGDMFICAGSIYAVLAYYEGENPYLAWQSAVYNDMFTRYMDALSEDNLLHTVKQHEENFAAVTG